MKLKEIEMNQSAVIPLVVIGATARETKMKKPYLTLDLFDGVDNISGNYWDWAGKAIPEKNAILDVACQLTEWNGTKQLNIKSIRTNTELHINEFMPSSGADIGSIYKQAYAMASDTTDPFLRELTLGVLEKLQPLWITVPGANSIHHAYAAGTLIHSLSVARLARTIAQHTVGAHLELSTIGGLLHDLGKLFGYRINGIVCEMTDEGLLLEHTFMGAEFIGNFAEDMVRTDVDEAKLEMLRHIILAHHGKREYGAAVPPSSIEAHIVSYADGLDAACEQIRDASSKVGNTKWTERIWALENRPHLTTGYVHAVMSDVSEPSMQSMPIISDQPQPVVKEGE